VKNSFKLSDAITGFEVAAIQDFAGRMLKTIFEQEKRENVYFVTSK